MARAAGWMPLLVVGGMLAASGCGGAPRDQRVPITPRGLYALAERSLTSGGLYHGTRQVTINGTLRRTVELWADAAHARARTESSAGDVTVIVGGTRSTSYGVDTAAVGCDGAGPVTAAVLGCVRGTATVGRTRHGGRSALVLTRHVSGDDITTYLDPATGLPFMHDEQSSVEVLDGVRSTTTNTAEFENRTGLPDAMYLPVPRQSAPFPPYLRNWQRLR